MGLVTVLKKLLLKPISVGFQAYCSIADVLAAYRQRERQLRG